MFHRPLVEANKQQLLAVFDLLKNDSISKTDRERVKQSSRELLRAVQGPIGGMDQWTETELRRAEVETLIIDSLYTKLPQPPFTKAEIATAANDIFSFVFQQSASSRFEEGHTS